MKKKRKTTNKSKYSKSNKLKLNKKNDEQIFTIFLIIFAILSFSLFLFSQIPALEQSINNINKKQISNKELIKISKDFINKNNLIENIDSYKTTIAIINSENEFIFLKRTIGFDNAIDYINKFNLSTSYHAIRFFKENELEEITIYYDSEKKIITRFIHYIPQNKELTELDITKEQAKVISLEFFKNNNINANNLIENDYSIEKIQKRQDHYFAFKVNNSEIKTDYGISYLLLTATIKGNQITSFDFYFFIPEEFIRVNSKTLSQGNLLSLFSTLATIIMFILAFIVLIIKFIQKKIKWKFFLFLSLICFALLFLLILNSIPSYTYNYTTEIPYSVYIFSIIIISIIFIFITCISIFVTGAAGESLANEIWKNKINDIIDITKKKFFSINLRNSVFRGYLIAMLFLGLTTLIYIIGERFLGVWILSTSSISSQTSSFFPFLDVFVISLISASIIEELTYRLFGISFFKKYFKKTFLSALIPTIIWAVAHSNYPVFPIYFRAIELMIIGLLFSYFFLRYNITTVIIAHYIIDTIYFGIPLITTGNPLNILSILLLILLPLIIPIISFIKKIKE